MKAANKALEISRAAGLAFVGPLILGTIARLAEDPAERRDALGVGTKPNLGRSYPAVGSALGGQVA